MVSSLRRRSRGFQSTVVNTITLKCQQTTNALPFSRERKGIISMAAFEEMIVLLLVVHQGALVCLALGIGSVGCDRAALAVGRDHNVGRKHNLAAFF